MTGLTSVTYRQFSVPLTNGTYYFRYLAQNLNDSRRYFGLGLFNGGTEQTLLGQGSGFETWTLNRVNGITNAMVTNILVSAVDTSDIGLLVLKLELTAGVERVTFWVNPNLSQPEDAATAVGGQAFFTDRDFGQITRVRIGGGGSSPTFGDPTEHYMDEIMVSPISPFVPPRLEAGLAGGQIGLAWPATHLGWTLQTNAAGIGQMNGWGDVEETGKVTATNLPADGTGSPIFYRLRSP